MTQFYKFFFYKKKSYLSDKTKYYRHLNVSTKNYLTSYREYNYIYWFPYNILFCKNIIIINTLIGIKPIILYYRIATKPMVLLVERGSCRLYTLEMLTVRCYSCGNNHITSEHDSYKHWHYLVVAFYHPTRHCTIRF